MLRRAQTPRHMALLRRPVRAARASSGRWRLPGTPAPAVELPFDPQPVVDLASPFLYQDPTFRALGAKSTEELRAMVFGQAGVNPYALAILDFRASVTYVLTACKATRTSISRSRPLCRAVVETAVALGWDGGITEEGKVVKFIDITKIGELTHKNILGCVRDAANHVEKVVALNPHPFFRPSAVPANGGAAPGAGAVPASSSAAAGGAGPSAPPSSSAAIFLARAAKTSKKAAVSGSAHAALARTIALDNHIPLYNATGEARRQMVEVNGLSVEGEDYDGKRCPICDVIGSCSAGFCQNERAQEGPTLAAQAGLHEHKCEQCGQVGRCTAFRKHLLEGSVGWYSYRCNGCQEIRASGTWVYVRFYFYIFEGDMVVTPAPLAGLEMAAREVGLFAKNCQGRAVEGPKADLLTELGHNLRRQVLRDGFLRVRRACLAAPPSAAASDDSDNSSSGDEEGEEETVFGGGPGAAKPSLPRSERNRIETTDVDVMLVALFEEGATGAGVGVEPAKASLRFKLINNITSAPFDGSCTLHPDVEAPFMQRLAALGLNLLAVVSGSRTRRLSTHPKLAALEVGQADDGDLFRRELHRIGSRGLYSATSRLAHGVPLVVGDAAEDVEGPCPYAVAFSGVCAAAYAGVVERALPPALAASAAAKHGAGVRCLRCRGCAESFLLTTEGTIIMHPYLRLPPLGLTPNDRLCTGGPLQSQEDLLARRDRFNTGRREAHATAANEVGDLMRSGKSSRAL